MGGRKRDKDRPAGLAGAFLDAGLVDGKRARRADRERRREDAALGAEGRARREAERLETAVAAQERDARAERARAEVDRARREEGSLREAVQAHVESARGPRRWFFVARDGRIPYVEVSDATARLLADGHAGVVESLGAAADEHVVVSGRQLLVQLSERDPDLVRFWNREPTRR